MSAPRKSHLQPSPAAAGGTARWRRWLRTYMLFVAIGTGGLFFLAFHFLPVMAPLKPVAYALEPRLTIILIFIILYLSFCRLNAHDMRPHWWHLEVLAIQMLSCFGIALWLGAHPDSPAALLWEGAFICIITPTAAAATTVAARLGGNESAVMTYTIACNLAAALCMPLFFPLFTQRLTGTFFEQFTAILLKVFPVMVLPLILAIATRFLWHRLHHFIVTRLKDLSFYLWGSTLTLISCKTIASVVNSSAAATTLWLMALMGLICTVVQFAIGKLLGQLEGQRISAGQSFGQKNMVFGIWIALFYLNPTAALAPGCYILWQNLVNAFQLWHRERLLGRAAARGVPPYQE